MLMIYNEAKLRNLIGKCKWTFAKTMPTCPHEYIVRNKCALSDEEFVYFVQSQRQFGIPQQWWKYNFPYLHIDGYKYWTMGDSINNTIIINRAKEDMLDKFRLLIHRIITFGEVLSKMETNKSYRMNVLDCLPTNENFNSALLAALFRQNKDGVFSCFKSFVKNCVNDSLEKIIAIPTIHTEEFVNGGKRIDIFVYELGKYAIIFENKIMDAPEQPNQLANYIEGVKAKGFENEQIYIVYLPRTDEDGPTDISWKNRRGYSYENDFKQRYVKVSFKKGILAWLQLLKKEQDLDQPLFLDSIRMYEDYLEGQFGMRVLDKIGTESMDKFIREAFHLAGTDDKNAAILIEQMELVDKLKSEMQSVKKELMLSVFNDWHQRLLKDFTSDNLEVQIGVGRFWNVGVLFPYNESESRICVKLEMDNNTNKLYYGYKYAEDDMDHSEEMREWLAMHPILIDGIQKGSDWMFFRYTTVETGYDCLQELISRFQSVTKK